MEGEDPLVALCRERIGRVVSGKWRLDALIGVGAMTAVYLATHKNGSQGALKLLHAGLALGQEGRERFVREAYIANKIAHPGVVRVLGDDKDDDGTPYIVSELLRGVPLAARARQSAGRLSIVETLEVLDQALAILEVAHAQAIVHRDLRPETMFVTDQGELKVLDFGIAGLRQEVARRTRTGMVANAPAFMAPEQAMGRWSDVDARTDLWALAATAFTLLSGQLVHEAPTAAAMLMAAATQPARSLASVLGDAPAGVVALLDRALAFERERRFPDAASFRSELQRIRPGLLAEHSAQAPLASAAPTAGASAESLAKSLSPSGVAGGRRPRVGTYDPSQNTDAEIEHMTRCFSSLQRALVATGQYGADHPESKRRFDEAYKEFASSLATCDVALSWNLTPYSFGARQHVIWEPEPPWNRIPYRFFSDGVRTMGLAPGLDEAEFRKWLHLMLLDPASDIAPEDDLVTMLGEAELEHLFFQAVDSFEEGTQAQRAYFEAERTRVLASARQDHHIALELLHAGGAPACSEAPKPNALEKTRELLRALVRAEGADAEALARIANLDVLEESPDEREAARIIHLDDNALMLLSARMELDVSATGERFVVAAAAAFVGSARAGRVTAVAGALRHGIDSLAASVPIKAIDMVVALHEAVVVPGAEPETAQLRDSMMAEVLSARALTQMLDGSKPLQAEAKEEYLSDLAKLLGWLQPIHFDAALAYLPDAPQGPLVERLLELVPRFASGHESSIGALFPKLDINLALRMVRYLAAIDTPEAKHAITMASASPHALVRIEGLGHVEGAAGARLRDEMLSLLEDPDPSVRLLTLRAMEEHDIAIAGPFLVLRIQDREFSRLAIEERRQALQTLSRLRAKRCEEVCMELLSDQHLLRSSASEETRELAAHFLAEVASGTPAYFLLQSIADSSLLRNSRRVRDAASAGLARLRQRADEAEQRKLERRSLAAARASMRVRKSERSGLELDPTYGTSLRPQPTGGAGPRMSRAPGTQGAVKISRAPIRPPGPIAAAGGIRISRAPGAERPSAPGKTPDADRVSRAPGAERPSAPGKRPVASKAPGNAAPVASRASRAPSPAAGPGTKAPAVSMRAPRDASNTNAGEPAPIPESGRVGKPAPDPEISTTRELSGKPAARPKARGKP